MKKRCMWAEHESMIEYHDEEWGVPVHDDKRHFEMITLEGAQSGLSWSTILKRRHGYRIAFKNFDPLKVSRMTQDDVDKLLNYTGIIRHRGKIESTINNAKCILEVQKEFGSFDNYIWCFVEGRTIQNRFKSLKELPASTPLSGQIASELKKKGFKFVGETTVYAYMQAVGLVNDHEINCFRYKSLYKK
ncbi:DNA-3-methyladenine glycosylase I [Spirochaetota bacterium]